MQENATEQIRKALRQRYSKTGFYLYEEVKRSSGYAKPERFADAIAISLFPSKGITLTGYEIKTRRSDLLAELRDPAKADAIKQFCDYWVLIVSNRSMLEGKIQVPDDWGIERFAPPNENLPHGMWITTRKAKQLYPKPPDRYFLASLLNQTNTAIGI